MRRWLLLTACFVIGCAFVRAQENLAQGEQLYRQGRYAEALSVYENDLKDYPNNPFLYYNIGNCYFKMGSNGLAIANYYRAFKIAPREEDIRHNLELALKASGEQLVNSDVPPALYRAFFYLSYPELKGLTFLLFWGWALMTCFWIVKRKGKTVCIVLSAALLISALWLWARAQGQHETWAVVAAPLAEVRSGPGTNFPANANVSQGHLLLIGDQKDPWYEVIIKSQGIKGWIEREAVEKI